VHRAGYCVVTTNPKQVLMIISYARPLGTRQSRSYRTTITLRKLQNIPGLRNVETGRGCFSWSVSAVRGCKRITPNGRGGVGGGLTRKQKKERNNDPAHRNNTTKGRNASVNVFTNEKPYIDVLVAGILSCIRRGGASGVISSVLRVGVGWRGGLWRGPGKKLRTIPSIFIQRQGLKKTNHGTD